MRLQAVLASAFDLPTVRNLSERVALITQKSFLSYPSIGIGEWQLSGRVTPDVTVLLRGDRLFQVHYNAIKPFGGYGCAHLDISPLLNHSL